MKHICAQLYQYSDCPFEKCLQMLVTVARSLYIFMFLPAKLKPNAPVNVMRDGTTLHRHKKLYTFSLPSPTNLHRPFSTLLPSPTAHNEATISHHSVVDFLDHYLKAHSKNHKQCQQIHCHVITTGTHTTSAFLVSRLVSTYSNFGRVFDALDVFETAPFGSNVLLWNSVIRCCVSNGFYAKAVSLYVRMRKLGFLGDGFTLPLVVKAFSSLGIVSLCEVIHCHVLLMGFGFHVHVGNELVCMYAREGSMRYARKVFDRMPARSLVSWNTMVSGYAFNLDCDGASDVFWRMEREGLVPNSVTWTSLISSHARVGWLVEVVGLFGAMVERQIGVSAEVIAVVLSVCVDLGSFTNGKVMHGFVVKGGFEEYLFVKNALIDVYGKFEDVNGAKRLFLEIENKSIVSWNALMASYAEAGLCDEALEIFSQMEVLKDSTSLRPNVISWSAVIDSFASAGRGYEALDLFHRMQLSGTRPTSVTLSSVLSACGELASLNLGKEIHGHIVRGSMHNINLVQNSLVNMYTKCGSLEKGLVTFQKIERKDLISWNTMITGYGMHGRGMAALTIFTQMIDSGFTPDAVTFVAVLSACSHSGLVHEARDLFHQMIDKFQIEPKVEHYACMVDLLGRAGLINEASQIIKNMPMKPNTLIWSALLNSCRMHKKMELAEETTSHFYNTITQDTTGSFMLLSNVYASSGMWHESARVRASAKSVGLKKNRGQSWIMLKDHVYMFSAGNIEVENSENIYEVLGALLLQMKGKDLAVVHGWEPDSSVSVLEFIP